MPKRLLSLTVAVSLVLCIITIFTFPVFAAESGFTIIDYRDYITGYELDDFDTGWALLHFPNDLCAVQTYDQYGYNTLPAGKASGTLYCVPDYTDYVGVTACWPGSYLTNSFLDASYIPNGSKMGISVSFLYYGSKFQTELTISSTLSVVYFDSDLNYIGSSDSPVETWVMHQENLTFYQGFETSIEKPAGTAYMCFYLYNSLVPGRSNDRDNEIAIEFNVFKPTLKISTSYVEIIVDGIVNGTPPPGYDSMSGLGDLEDYLKDNTTSGRDEVGKVLQDSASPILDHSSGFLFLAWVIDDLFSIPWLAGLLKVSLALGVFGFLCNIVMVAGRSSMRRSERVVRARQGGSS